MIKDSILAELKRRFPDQSYSVGDDARTVAVFPAAHTQVGNVTIWDDGDEATVFIENITHGHFTSYDETLSKQEREKVVTEDVVDFLSELFADRVLLWTSESGRSGGWKMLQGQSPAELMHEKAKCFLWSGPIKRGRWPTIGLRRLAQKARLRLSPRRSAAQGRARGKRGSGP
jgi:hypothetical protein